ncbi:MAG TPA: CHASE2 domain-containing protein [Pyrinomonadaceae bacterium]|jgi:hypothetical protein
MKCTDSVKNDFKHAFGHLWSEVSRQLRGRSRGHWLTVVVLIAVGTFLGGKLGEQNIWIEWRYKIYQSFLQHVTPRRAHPKRTAMVLIGDQEYWNGPFARRYPLKRDLLAQLLRKIEAANPEVIALDIDLSSPAPLASPDELVEYRAETLELLDAVKAVSRNRTVVLAKGILDAGHGAGYELEPAVFDSYDFEGGDVRKGYISLPTDVRRVPLAMPLRGGGEHDSLASAIAGAVDERAVEDARAREHDSLPYGSFIPPEEFVRRSAGEVLAAEPEALRKDLGFKVVILGGAWHKFGLERGPKNDEHMSPVGAVYGAFIHANYVEALLDSRTYNPIGERAAVAIEVTISVLLALILSLHIRLSAKLVAALIFCLVMMAITYVSWQNLGMFFDFFIPVVLLVVHVLVEKFRE